MHVTLLAAFLALPCLAGAMVVGGPVQVTNDKVDETTKEFYNYLADEAMRHVNHGSSDEYYWKLDRLIQTDKQVVNGIKYRLQFTSVKTQCHKADDKERITLGLCAVQDTAPKQICEFEIVVRAWEHSEQLMYKGCRYFSESEAAMTPTMSPIEATEDHTPAKPTIDRTAEDVFYLSKHIKPKDFAVWNLFTGFMDRFSRKYTDKREILRRFRIYKRNMKAAKVFQKQELGTAVYGETQFMDLTPTEFKKIYLPYEWPKTVGYPVRRLSASEIADEPIPKSFDWREKGIVTPVKNQGICGSCWAFSVTGNIEGQWAKATGKLVSLSEQELVDCDIIDQGCNGGLPLNAYKEIIRMGGLEPEDAYPYDGKSETCHLARKDIAVYINDSLQLPADEGKMAIWLFKNGPISIGVNANPLQFYRHGISHPWKIFCSPVFLNHGVLIVGYGQEGNKPFWIIKNSWGANWGESGYYRLYRGKNVCGVNEMATSSIVKKASPAK